MTQPTARSTPQPRGVRRPRPDLLPQVIRALALGCVALALAPLQQLAHVLPAPATSDLLAVLGDPRAAAGAALAALCSPPVAVGLRLAALAALAVIGAELSLAALLLPLQALRWRCSRPPLVLRVRLPRPAGGAGVASDGAALLHAIHAALPTGVSGSGAAAWCALVAGVSAQQPAELAVVVGGPRQQRERAARSIAAAIVGAAPEALVEAGDDRLRSSLAQGRVIVWREFGARLGPEYPLRTPADGSAGELLGPLLVALRPAGRVVYSELQVVLRPMAGVQGWSLGGGWRARVTALKLALEQKDDYALAPDIAALDARRDGAAFAVTLRAVAVAEGPAGGVAAGALLDGVADALGGLQRRTASRVQRLIPWGGGRVACGRVGRSARAAQLLARGARAARPPRLLLPVRPWRRHSILSAAEVSGLWRLADAALGELVAWLPCRRLAPPPHAFLQGGDEQIALGSAPGADGAAAVGTTLRDLRQVLHLTAGMGAGKSRLLANLCQQFLHHGFTLIDGKGDDQGGSLVATVRRLVPLADERRLVILDVLDAAWPIGLNPLAGVDLQRVGGGDLALGQILAVFARIDPETWGAAPGMQQFLRMAALLVLGAQPAPTLAHVRQALTDDAYRARLLPLAANPEVRAFWCEVYPRLGDGQRASRDALLRRFDALLTAETTRYLVTQAEPTVSLLDAIEQRLIVLVPLPDMTLGGLAGAVGTLALQAFVRAAFARGGSDQERPSYPLVVDELQVLVGAGDAADLEAAVTRLRSLGIPAVYAHQALAQLGELRDLLLINAANRVILQTQEPDASVYARACAAVGLTAADIAQQDPAEHQYAVLRCGGRPAGPFSMRPLPWPTPAAPEVPRYDGGAWSEVLPAERDPIDPYVLRLAYEQLDEARAVAELAALDERGWRRLLARWDAIRRCQRSFILAHPGSIPDQLERQRWLSRLLVARPRLLAAAEYARARGATPQCG